jgi:hypothetical protein
VVPDVSKESVAFIFKVSVVHEEFFVGHCNDGKPIIQRDSNNPRRLESSACGLSASSFA